MGARASQSVTFDPIHESEIDQRNWHHLDTDSEVAERLSKASLTMSSLPRKVEGESMAETSAHNELAAAPHSASAVTPTSTPSQPLHKDAAEATTDSSMASRSEGIPDPHQDLSNAG